MVHLSEFLYRWQDLSGAFIGPFLAVILSGFSYLFGRYIEKKQQGKEAMRRIEVSVTYTINNIASMQKKLLRFVVSLRGVVSDIHAIENLNEYATHATNFPSLGTIHRDEELTKLPTKSYYIHNKLLWLDSGINDLNNILSGMKEDFARVIGLNEKMLDLMKDNPNPPEQRASYADNLSNFANEIERFANEDLVKSITPLMQVKIYNDLLRRPWGHGVIFLWQNEGSPSWFLQRLSRFKAPARNLDNIDQIDKRLQPEVDEAIEAANKKGLQEGVHI